MQRANLSSIRQHIKHCQSKVLHCAVVHFKYCQLAVLQIGAAGLHSWLMRNIWGFKQTGYIQKIEICHSRNLKKEKRCLQLSYPPVLGCSHGMLMLYNFKVDVDCCTYVQRVCGRRREGWEGFQLSRRVETPLGKAIRNSSGAPYWEGR